MVKKPKLSAEKTSKATKQTIKNIVVHEPVEVKKTKPIKIVKAALKRADQQKSKAFDAASDAVGKMLPDGARLVSEACSTDSSGTKLISGTSAGAEHDLKSHSKQDLLIALLKHPEGASLSQIMKATGWQAHTVRGVISGVLRKKLCLQVVQERGVYGTAVYKIVEAG